MIVQSFLQKIVPDPRDCATHPRVQPESLTPKGAVSRMGSLGERIYSGFTHNRSTQSSIPTTMIFDSVIDPKG